VLPYESGGIKEWGIRVRKRMLAVPYSNRLRRRLRYTFDRPSSGKTIVVDRLKNRAETDA